MSLRKLAEGQPCYLRLDGCSFDPKQTVLAHQRVGGVAGTAIKPPDICGLPLDDYCHGVVDGRIKTHLSREYLEAELFRAHNQWLAYLDSLGYQLVLVEPKLPKILPRRAWV